MATETSRGVYLEGTDLMKALTGEQGIPTPWCIHQFRFDFRDNGVQPSGVHRPLSGPRNETQPRFCTKLTSSCIGSVDSLIYSANSSQESNDPSSAHLVSRACLRIYVLEMTQQSGSPWNSIYFRASLFPIAWLLYSETSPESVLL